jgi:hypothetical protein
VGSAKRERHGRLPGAAPSQQRGQEESGTKAHSPDHVISMGLAFE